MRRFLSFWLVVAVVGMGKPSTRAEYILLLTSAGRDEVVVERGQEFETEVQLLSNSDDRNNSILFDVKFEAGGLVVQSYEWTAPYLTDEDHDDSRPRWSQLPVELEMTDGIAPELQFSNVIPLGAGGARFGTGALLRMRFLVPEDYAGPAQFSLSIRPDTVADGFRVIPAVAGPPLRIRIGPEAIERPKSDDDGDGLPNFVEAALGLDPAVRGRPVMTLTSPGLPDVRLDGSGPEAALVFRFWKFPRLPGVTYRVQSSADMVVWTDEPDALVQSAPGEAEIREVRLPIAGSNRFLRLAIELNAPAD